MKLASPKGPHIVWLHLYEIFTRGNAIERLSSRLVVAWGGGATGKGFLSGWGKHSTWWQWWLHECTQRQWTVHGEWVTFMVCVLYLKKPLKKTQWQDTETVLNSRLLGVHTTHDLNISVLWQYVLKAKKMKEMPKFKWIVKWYFCTSHPEINTHSSQKGRWELRQLSETFH